jgi:hypothetical protein
MGPTVLQPPCDGLQGSAHPTRTGADRKGTPATPGCCTARRGVDSTTEGGERTCNLKAKTTVNTITNFREFSGFFHSMTLQDKETT